MDNKIDKILEKLHSVDKKVDMNTVTLDRNADDIAEHIRRTNLLESQMHTALLPIQWAQTTAKVITVTGIILGALYTLFNLIKIQ